MFIVGVKLGALGFTLSSGDASDSICPKGWGMAEVDVDGSYQKLIANAYGMNKANKTLAQKYKEYNVNIHIRELGVQYPLSLVWSESYSYNTGTFGDSKGGYVWENKAITSIVARNLGFHSNGLNPQSSSPKGFGLSVRCVARISLISIKL